jgi:uncharacterized protein
MRTFRVRRAMATLYLQIKAKPMARASALRQEPDGTWTAQLRSKPEGGRANEELIGLVAEHFKCGRAAVSIKSGGSSRQKLVKVETA